MAAAAPSGGGGPPDPAAAVAARIRQQFERRAAAYDDDPSGYHERLADGVVALARLQPGERLLDLACGTGHVALRGAAAVGPSGRVVGVDLSGAMLQRARAKARDAGVAAWTEWREADVEDAAALAAALVGAGVAGVAGGGGEAGGGEGGGGGGPCWFDAATMSAALPFVRDAPRALKLWRGLLHPQRGRLAINGFVAPAVADFGTFCQVAARHGLDVRDPCAATGSEELLRGALLEAGFSRANITAERRTRHIAAASPREYAERMWLMSSENNPFLPPLEELLGGGEAAVERLRADVVDAIERDVAAAARFQEGRGVASGYTVLNALAYVAP